MNLLTDFGRGTPGDLAKARVCRLAVKISRILPAGRRWGRLLLLLMAAGWMGLRASGEIVQSDICVYGGTSSGVTAAVEAVKLGKTVVVVEPGRHLGGLSSSGLGWTDIGNKAAIGGLSRHFYQQMGHHYGKAEAWTFEPSVAEREFEDQLREAKVPVYFQQQLVSVVTNNVRLTELVTQSGDVFRAKMFIDATYEGDLMAMAGVSYFIGREANAVYGETLDGIRGATPQHQFLVPVDPYRKAGDSASGLLPFIQPVSFGRPGDGDQSVQAYNFRLCLTKNPANRKPIEPPAHYDPAQYELLGRYFDALASAHKHVTLGNFLNVDMVTSDKTDINNNGGFSTDYIGGNYNYPGADYATRERIQAEHLDYTKGLLTYLATSPRVPVNVRREMQTWGLCKDEFPDTGGWPHAMYVREARRMVSDYVMTEKNCRHVEIVSDSVGLAAYNMDSHNCRRLVRGGHVENEGDVEVAPTSPYPIAYRAMVPAVGQCANLLVPVCLSASHIAYGSIRMEPVFMILGQSAATAAAIAIDNQVPVQKVPYDQLRSHLLADGQVLEWKKSAN
ncbi:MAG: FAD-dependent oxidoreductase [Verrucomicrobiota bacterium]